MLKSNSCYTDFTTNEDEPVFSHKYHLKLELCRLPHDLPSQNTNTAYKIFFVVLYSDQHSLRRDILVPTSPPTFVWRSSKPVPIPEWWLNGQTSNKSAAIVTSPLDDRFKKKLFIFSSWLNWKDPVSKKSVWWGFSILPLIVHLSLCTLLAITLVR